MRFRRWESYLGRHPGTDPFSKDKMEIIFFEWYDDKQSWVVAIIGTSWTKKQHWIRRLHYLFGHVLKNKQTGDLKYLTF
jgi:hypothetical protein